jgi:hypothetical protein
MSDRLHDDPELDAFFADVVDGVEYDVDGDGAVPDLAAVVALAHAMDPSRVSATAVDEVAAYAPVVALDAGRRFRQTRDDLEMNSLVQQVRAHVDLEVARELSQPPQQAPAAAPAPRYWWVGVLVAAALVLGIGIGTLQATQVLEELYTNDQSEALHSDRADEDESQTAVHREPEPTPAPAPAVEPTPAVEPAPAPVDAIEEATPETEPKRATKKRRGAKEVVAAPAETLDEKLARLDREAHAAWQAGKLGRAEQLFGEIARLDEQGKLAGLAYGDMFTLARQRGDKTREVALWKAYLKRFPRGRFADDARAGLCRVADGQARIDCWTAYLEDMPRGSYRTQARREVGSSGAP